MINILQFYEAGKARSGTALFPFIDSAQAYIQVSTRTGNILVKWGDGTETNSTTSKNVDATVTALSALTYNYSPNYTGDVQVIFKQGLRDVYSILFNFSRSGDYNRILDIQNIETFFKQFPNLYSIFFEIYSYGTSKTVIKGDLSKLPDSIERIKFNGFEVKNSGIDQWLNLSNYSQSSKLKYFNFSKEGYGVYPITLLKIIGNLSSLPPNCQFFKIAGTHSGSSITYTAGKVWASSFDTLYLPIPLSFTENDNLLNDMKNSITTAIGGKVIYLGNSFRTASSDAAVAYLTGLGFTISGVVRQRKILDLPLQNSFTDISLESMSIIAANANGLPSFVAGPKGADYAVDFTGTKSLKTALNLAISNSDKVSISFWIKTTQTALAFITELSPTASSNNGFYIASNEGLTNCFTALSNSGQINIRRTNANTNNVWHHVVMVIDRSLDATSELKIYIDKNVMPLAVMYSLGNNTSGNFGAFPLFIGQRNGASSGFIGQLAYLKVFNYPLSQLEIDNLYNI